MLEYKFNKKTGVLNTTIKGEVSIQDLINYIISVSEDKTLPKTLKVFTDASEGRYSKDVQPEDMYKIVEANKISLAQRDMIYDAFVISSSLEVALGQLYMEFSKSSNYRFNIFSTKKAAVNWLNQF